ncbi:two-component system phosphate regulon sensor histidine kinase PhoR [Arthrobacter sp. UYP6]|uniref:sensor histidine kinase n=1 Tax=Arthrobacter sp. UYP6 TaxID=1756378 RepID=UPI003395ED85
MSSFEHHAMALLGIRNEFHELSLRLRVALSQLPVVVSVIATLPLVGLISPQTFSENYFQLGLVLLTVGSVASVAVPWDRLFIPAYWLIPLLDFIVVCCLYTGGRSAVTGLSLLCVFPVFWLAWSGAIRPLAALLSFAGSLLVVWSPLIAAGQISIRDLAGPMLIPLIMVGIFATVAVVEQDTSAQRKRLAESDARLQSSLRDSRVRSQLLDGVLETVDVGVMALDAEGNTLLTNSRQRANHSLAGLLGEAESSDRALIFGLDQVTLVAPDQRPACRAMREESFSDVIVWVGTGQDQRALTVCARTLHDNGQFAGSVLAYSDVTEMVNALNAKEDFVSSVSHELRTPLTSIIGYLDLVLDDMDPVSVPEHVHKALEVAQRNAERLLLLVSDLLTTASGTMHLHASEVDVSEMVRSSMDSARWRSNAAGVALREECQPGLLAQLDPDRVSQVLDNLLSNAIKYSPEGGVATVRTRSMGGMLVFEVEDTGMGMSEADQRDVFTKFFRTGQVKKAAIPGVGLGLVISKSIVEAHGGKISFQSELGTGTTFRVEMPLARSPQGQFSVL